MSKTEKLAITDVVTASCQNTYDSSTKRIHTPNYPDHPYNINANCNWKIVSSSGGPITLKFADFDLEYQRDYLEIYDGQDNTANSKYTRSGNGDSAKEDFQSSGGSLFLQFTSDSQDMSNKGFDITISWEGNMMLYIKLIIFVAIL